MFSYLLDAVLERLGVPGGDEEYPSVGEQNENEWNIEGHQRREDDVHGVVREQALRLKCENGYLNKIKMQKVDSSGTYTGNEITFTLKFLKGNASFFPKTKLICS
jgi:hypothetical protein